MTGQELKTIRKGLGLSVIEMGLALGYQGNDNTLSVQIRRYELGYRPIPPWIGRLAYMYSKFGIPEG
jgi:transcriptional regulator with XRE-family HTH domain